MAKVINNNLAIGASHRRYGIRTVQSINQEISDKLNGLSLERQRWYKRLFNKRARRRTIRYGLLVVNVFLLIGVVVFVTQAPSGNTSSTPSLSSAQSDEAIASPLDELSSADIAVHVARATRLPESTSVTNLADTVDNQLAVSTSDNVVSAKPQVIATSLPSRADILVHTVKKNENLSKIANKYNLTTDTIRWSNDLSGDVSEGDKLYISPVDGLLYKVLASDTINDIADRFNANKEKLIAINDLETGRLPVGERIIVPGGEKPQAIVASSTSTSSSSSYSSYGSGLSFGSAPIYGYNGYDPGWCTWYAASRVNVPINWGNANTWDEGARRSGWTVSSVPKVGAIAQTNVGWAGHVGIVEAVSPDGKMVKYSDMNGLAGFGRVGYSGWVPVHGKYENYIYR